MSRDNSKRLKGSLPEEPIGVNIPASSTNLNLIGDISLVVPTQLVELPSEGKFYDKQSTLHGKKTIEIKALTAREEDILSSSEFLKAGVVFEKLLDSIIIDKSIDHSELIPGDKNSLLIAARISGYGSEYSVRKECPNCEKEGDFIYDLTHAKPKEIDLEVEGVEFKDSLFWFSLPNSKVLIAIKPITGKDRKYLEVQNEKKQKLNLETTQLLDFLRLVIVEAGGSRERALLNQFIEIMPAIDSRKIRTIYNKVMPDLDTSQTLTCSLCSREHESEVWFGVNFFWPDI